MVIVAGIVFILSVVFVTGAFIFGHRYLCHHRHGPMYQLGGPGLIVPIPPGGPGGARSVADDHRRQPGAQHADTAPLAGSTPD